MTHARPLGLALLLATALLLVAPPAMGESVRVKDTFAGQPAHQNIQRGTLSYSEDGVVTYRVKYEGLSKKYTRLCTKFIRPRTTVQVCTKWHDGEPTITGHLGSSEGERLPKAGINVNWNFTKDVIIVKLSDEVRGVHGSEADMLAFSLYPGAQHGHPQGDDLYAAGVQRG